jgi:HSP20 family protein
MSNQAVSAFGNLSGGSCSMTNWPPVCDIYETDKNIVITAELPEVKKEDVRVTFEHNLLTIGSDSSQVELMRCFQLPNFVYAKNLSAEFKAGVLRVTIEKHERVLPRKVELKIAA